MKIITQNKNFNNEATQTVNARDLHSQLKSKQDFSTWVKKRLSRFVENEDYLRHKVVEQHVSGSKHKIEYYLTIDCAKSIAMLENNSAGDKVRKYFIQLEKEFKKQGQFPIPKTLEEALEAHILLLKEEKALREAVEQKDNFIGEHIAITTEQNYTEVAKALGLKPKDFIQFLRDNKYISKTKTGKRNRVPMSKELESGRFVIKHTRREVKGEGKSFYSYLITEKGYKHFSKLKERGNLCNSD